MTATLLIRGEGSAAFSPGRRTHDAFRGGIADGRCQIEHDGADLPPPVPDQRQVHQTVVAMAESECGEHGERARLLRTRKIESGVWFGEFSGDSGGIDRDIHPVGAHRGLLPEAI